jgi:hypothetical protein
MLRPEIEGYSLVSDDQVDIAAEKKGLCVKLPNERQLFVDIDSEHSKEVFDKNLTTLSGFFRVMNINITPSASAKPWHYHAVVELEQEITPLERVALQAVLGSDTVRELLSFVSIMKGYKKPTVFFERKAFL